MLGQEQSVEIEERALNGFFHITVSPLYNEAGELIACVHVARDITEQKKGEAERLALEHQLQQAQKLESLGVLAGGIAHDFNNILMIILGHCSLAKQDAPPDSWEASHLEPIEIAASRAADLCRQMLAYAGKSPLVQTEMDLQALVMEIAAILKSGMKKNVTLEHDCKADTPQITGDIGQIQQIVMNLMVNAGEAIGENRGVIRVELSRCEVQQEQGEDDVFGNAIPAGTYARLDVVDTGCGMTPETQTRIFEPFFTTKFTGRGLGLSAMIGILKAHQGALQISSELGVGTTFRVYFAANTTVALTEPPPRRESDLSAPSSSEEKGRTVLLVDDEHAVRRIGARMLTGMGYAVITAQNGHEAVEIYRAHPSSIDLIMMDLTMPEMDGIEAYHAIRSISTTVPIVICSGYGQQEISSFLRDDPRASAVPKPYRPNQLQDTLTTLLAVCEY